MIGPENASRIALQSMLDALGGQEGVSAICLTEEAEDAAGLIPHFLNASDARPAREQLDEAYAHGGGWHPLDGFTQEIGLQLRFPGDPVFEPQMLLFLPLSMEVVAIYRHALVAVFRPDGGEAMEPVLHEVARMD